MALSRRDQEKLAKSLVILGVGNALTIPAYFYSFGLGFLSSLVSNTCMLFGLHSTGQGRRPAQNLVNQANNFFGVLPSQNITNSFYNIIDGGESVFDEVSHLGNRRR